MFHITIFRRRKYRHISVQIGRRGKSPFFLLKKYIISLRKNCVYYLNLGIKNKSAKNNIQIDEKADFIIEGDIQVPIERVFGLISNFKYRKLWDTSLAEIVFHEGQVNRPGSNHTCMIGNRKMKFETVRIDSKSDLSYCENTSNLPMINNYRFYILLDKLDQTSTRVKILNYVNLNWLGQIVRKSIYSKLEISWIKKLKKLEEVGLNNI